MKNIPGLTRRIDTLIAKIAPREQDYSRVVLYDATTGEPLPGQRAAAPGKVTIWIPDNGRDGYANR